MRLQVRSNVEGEFGQIFTGHENTKICTAYEIQAARRVLGMGTHWEHLGNGLTLDRNTVGAWERIGNTLGTG